MSNSGKEVSYNNMSKVIGIKSVRTTIDYCDYLKESYLLDSFQRSFQFIFGHRQILLDRFAIVPRLSADGTFAQPISEKIHNFVVHG
jgi:predicted AAA+ superfamily ATPase